MSGPLGLPSWPDLRREAEVLRARHLRSLFAEDGERFARLSFRFEDLLLDLSKQRWRPATLLRLCALLREAGFEARREALFAGGIVNRTENRPALHTALRDPPPGLRIGDLDVGRAVGDVLARMERFVAAVRGGTIRSAAGEPFREVVHIGIGGSELGPRLVCEALAPYADGRIRVHFLSNIDPRALFEVLGRIDLDRSLLLVASKSFTTLETLDNARALRARLESRFGPRAATHLVALTARPARARAFGIAAERIFEFWDWVGGRYSLWSAVGLPIALFLGFDRFRELLAGARAMDVHFRTAPLEGNLPVLAALVGIWNVNLLGFASRAVVPYDHGLRSLVAHLQQLEMESNGKSVTEDGVRVSWHTSPVVWGGPGTDGQHAFFQLLHQGSRILPCEFLAACESPTPAGEMHEKLLANALAQARALAFGRDEEETRRELEARGLPPAEVARLLPHRRFEGNRPSSFLLYRRLTPYRLGGLLALFEHRVFTEGVVWGIDSFDQWGVELGKEMALRLLPAVRGGSPEAGLDSSTRGLLAHLRRPG